MSFYLISEGLTCLGMFNGAYESLKALSRAEKGIEVSTLTQILEFWIALGALTIFEEYAEFFVSWIPFYYFFKCMLLGLLLVPSTKISHVLYHGFIEPTMDKIQEQVHARVLPVVESLVVQHGHWFHERLLSRSLTLLDDQALNEYEQELQTKLQDVRNEVRERRQRPGKEHSEAK
ncbi:hypothetical protein Poli38472_000389 [Pythium oligandrum]|uniref:HVA22-like protein n=1 Tax=Pythium oligandrum TaxID=41045 RepID=A0A8K1FI23_PYTOL|nr:hypothetical protein Poli38472_000389 [Pythium oligandrum]|eukprot:TMW60347.1 hypothetical protein Poli38472_000389 [Pythium oligandrum]